MSSLRPEPDLPLSSADEHMMVCPTCNTTFPQQVEVCPFDGDGLLVVPNTPLLSGGTLDGRYEMGRVIGSGGMGTVYRAWQPSMEREVAIKVLHPKYACEPRAVKRFFREAQAASRLIHPNVVTVYDCGRSRDGHLYMVMELVEGWTLGDLIHYQAPLEPALAITLGGQICDALEAAHERRIVHRDLKPDNVQLTTDGARVWAKVLDFGIARVLRDGDGGLVTQGSTVDIAGTPAYMSPEQILGKDPHPRSDLYSLGVILYEMLTGKRPFADENSVTLCMKQINDRPQPIEERMPDPGSAPAGLLELVHCLLEKDPDDRPRDAAHVRDLLLACPGARTSIAAKALLLPRSLETGVAAVTTRPDAGLLMEMPTLQASAADTAGQPAFPAKLGDILQQVRRPGPETPSRPCGTCGSVVPTSEADCPRCHEEATASEPGRSVAVESDEPKQRPRRRSRRGPPGVVAHIAVPSGRLLREGRLSTWLAVKEQAGWRVSRRPGGVLVRIGSDGPGLAEVVAELLDEVRAAAGSRHALRVGVAPVEGGAEADAVDAARRLAAVAPGGTVALPAAAAEPLGLRARPLTGVFRPTGRPMACVAVRAVEGESPAVESAALQGRSAILRRLDMLADEARRDGPRVALLTGERGAGRTAIVRALAADRSAVSVRCAPAAEAWPGHSAAVFVCRVLGISGRIIEAEVEAELDKLGLRDREVLSVLLLDRGPEDEITLGEIARALVDLVAARVGDEPQLVALDDAHQMDRASAAIFDLLLEIARGRPWLFVATALEGHEVPLRGERIDARLGLRKLGLRAGAVILESAGVPPAQQSRIYAHSAGNPLAMKLLAQLPAGAAFPPPERVVRSLLPETLRHLKGREAEEAWLAAACGDDERDRRRVQAARLYMDVGMGAELEAWLVKRMRKAGGAAARLVAAWEPPEVQATVERAERLERLGLWELAEEAWGQASVRRGGGRSSVGFRLQAARMRARRGDLTGAVRYFEDSVRQGPIDGHATEVVSLARALLAGQETARAERMLERVSGACRSAGDPGLTAELHGLLARCHVRRGDIEGALALLDRVRDAWQALRSNDARSSRTLEVLEQEVRAEIAIATGDLDAARTNLRQARDALRDLGRQADAIRCLIELGRVELSAEKLNRASDTFRAAVTLAGAAGLRGALQRGRVGLGETLVLQGDMDEGLTLLRTALRETGGRNGQGVAFAEAALGMARAMRVRGLVADAVRYAERGRSAAAGTAVEARACLVLAEVHAAGGNLRSARRFAEEAGSLADAQGNGFLRDRANALGPGDGDARPSRRATGRQASGLR